MTEQPPPRKASIVADFAEVVAYDGLRISPIATTAGLLLAYSFNPFVFVAMLCVGPVAAAFGTFVGYFGGAIAGTVTVYVFREIRDERAYLWTMVVVTAASAFVFVVPLVAAFQAVNAVNSAPVINTFTVGSGVIAAVSAAYPGYRVGRAYLAAQAGDEAVQ